jgi:DNA-binding GntR family transcriptional regulator
LDKIHFSLFLYTKYKTHYSLYNSMDKIIYADLSQQAYRKLKAMILNEELKPGEKIRQEKIAEMLGVSRTPLHKAFQMLENELLVQSIPRKGIFVKTPDMQEIVDAFECREGIEGMAIRRAARVIKKSQVDKLYALFAPFLENAKKADLTRYQDADHTFHNTIIKISGNKILAKMELLANILHRTYLKGLIRPPLETLPEHMAIIDALKNHDADKAEKGIREHFRKSRNVVEKSIKQNNS